MKWKIILIILVVLLALSGAGMGVYLVQQQQDIQDHAAVSGGVAEVYLQPAAKTVTVGTTFPVDVYFSTGGETVSAMAIQLQFDFSGAEPSFEVVDIVPNSEILLSGDWSFPVKKIEKLDGQVQVRVAAINLSTAGYSSSADTKLVTLNMKANVAGNIVMEFDSTQSKITKKSTAEDVLLIPISKGQYTATGVSAIGGPIASLTPTPTSTVLTPTGTASPSPSPTGSSGSSGSSSSGTSVVSSTPTPVGELLSTASTETTLVLGSLGVFLLIFGLIVLVF